jgi:uncharacterized heparinase superfamily protein
LLGPFTFCFLTEMRDLDAGGWEDGSASKLWLYNLHYFDDLNAVDANARRAWHVALIARWIAETTPGAGAGWEPYPTSLRIVNWIKAARGGLALSHDAIQSLAVQTRWLTGRLERHLLGNHLFANAKALVFAGCFFEGPEADRWMSRGLAILARESSEQVLPDGGQFELSPMYHALAVEDFLDLLNVMRSSGREPPTDWAGRIASMRAWLATMTHPDGEIAFFNDAAFGIAPLPAELESYAKRLELPPPEPHAAELRHLADSGYVRVDAGLATAWLDVGRIGPDYLPGHAHADTLSFELAICGRRVIVNSGTSVYGTDAERQRQRGTAAHNTVVIDRSNSSEVWSGFRVARRARPQDLKIFRDGGLKISCGHDGYRWKPGRPEHHRSWSIDPGALTVEDHVTGKFKCAEAIFHFHPDFELVESDAGNGSARAADGTVLSWTIARGRARIEASTWHPEFGRSDQSQRVVVELVDGESSVKLTWHTD